MTKNNTVAGFTKGKGKVAFIDGLHRVVKLDELNIDPSYQRRAEPEDVAAIADNYNPALLGQITVTERRIGNGRIKLYVVDGQHRVLALRRMGIAAVLCYMVPTKSVEEEARLFHLLNTTAKAVHAFDLFKARLKYGDETASEISQIVHGEGLLLSLSKERNTIAAVNALEKVHVQHGNLAAVLRILNRWQNGAAQAFDGVFIADLGAFLAAYPSAVEGRMISALQRYEPRDVKRETKRVKAELVCSRADAARIAIKKIYNEKLHAKQRLRAPVEVAL